MSVVRLGEVDVLFFQIVNCIMGVVLWRAVLLKCSFVMTEFCSDVRQEALFQDDLTVVT